MGSEVLLAISLIFYYTMSYRSETLGRADESSLLRPVNPHQRRNSLSHPSLLHVQGTTACEHCAVAVSSQTSFAHLSRHLELE